MTLGGILSIHRTERLLWKIHTSTHISQLFEQGKRFSLSILDFAGHCYVRLLVWKVCIVYLPKTHPLSGVETNTHTVVTSDTSFPTLVDVKHWDAIKYCSAVPTFVQGICVVSPFPADLIAPPCWDLSWAVFPLWQRPQHEIMLQVWKPIRAQAEFRTDYPSITLSLTRSHPWGLQPRKAPFPSHAL